MMNFRLNVAGWACQVIGTLFLLLDSIRVGVRLPREGITMGDPPAVATWYYQWASPIGFFLLLTGFVLCGVVLWLSRPRQQPTGDPADIGAADAPRLPDLDVYKEIVRHWEHHSRWRERLFNGYLVSLGAVATAYYWAAASDSPVAGLRWVVPFSGLLLALTFLLANHRVNEVLDGLIASGRSLESRGVFAEKPAQLLTHRTLLLSVYGISGVGFLVLLLYELCWRKPV
jgi:hypothetical protein